MKLNYISKIKDLQLDNSFKRIRGGIILYCIHPNGTTMLGMGIDRISKEITDFGGGIKRDETFIEGSLREFNEESLDVFCDVVTHELLEDSYGIVGKNLIIIFAKVPYEIYYQRTELFTQKYLNSVSMSKSVEVIAIVWIKREILEKLIEDNKNSFEDKNNLYKVVKSVLKETKEVFDMLT